MNYIDLFNKELDENPTNQLVRTALGDYLIENGLDYGEGYIALARLCRVPSRPIANCTEHYFSNMRHKESLLKHCMGNYKVEEFLPENWFLMFTKKCRDKTGDTYTNFMLTRFAVEELAAQAFMELSPEQRNLILTSDWS